MVYSMITKSVVILLWSPKTAGLPDTVCVPIVIDPEVTAAVTLNSLLPGVPVTLLYSVPPSKTTIVVPEPV